MAPSASIVVPTRGRAAYLEVALASIVPQARALGAEVIVVEDGAAGYGAGPLELGDTRALERGGTRAVAERAGVRYLGQTLRRGANAARNAGLAQTTAPLVVLVDDDVRAAPGWLEAYLAAAAELPDVDVFGGPIRPSLEGSAPNSCGEHGPPFTFLDRGEQDADIEYAWSANMMARRSAFDRVGGFREELADSGEEEEWEDRATAGGGRVRYVARAAVEHRRAGADARLRSLARVAYGRGRASRRYQVSKGPGPTLAAELRTLVATLGHAARRRCGVGLVLAAHNAGRLHEALAPEPFASEDFLSGRSGTVGGRRAMARRLADDALDRAEAIGGRGRRLDAAAQTLAPLRVLAVIVRRDDAPGTADASRAELLRSRHHVEVAIGSAGGRGKFENVNRLLRERGVDDRKWLLVVDDDVELPSGFLDRFLFLAERYGLALAQPAQTLSSHAAWGVVRRRPLSVLRETSFVEIGPVTGLRRETFDELLPFPDLRAAWGLDLHWSALARQHGWRLGIVDAVPVRHELRTVASHYGRGTAIDEARGFLADRPYVPREQVRTLAVHRRWR